MWDRKIYYQIKPFLPKRVHVALRKKLIQLQRKRYAASWPIDESAGRKPEGWKGWPGGKKFALILTHDVETALGHAKCKDLMELEIKAGFRSSFNFVAERYNVSPELRNTLVANGFEVGVHGLKHDGKLYRSREIFKERAVRINHYLALWDAVGFRSPAMHHNLEWISDLNIEYDASTFDTDPFEPQPDGMGTIFPFSVKSTPQNRTYIELPYTLPQDSTLFIFMEENNIEIWIRKLDWIVQQGGMALLIVHPDYMNFDNSNYGFKEYPAQYYVDFLSYIQSKYTNQYLNVLPKQIASFWRGLT